MGTLVNLITISRIPLSLYLLITVPLSLEFYIVYALCGMTDILDGAIARKTNTVSELGGRLDSLADFIMVFIVLYILVPVIEVKTIYIILAGVIILIRFISIAAVAYKFRTFGVLHTRLNKATGLILFVYPFSMTLKLGNILAFLVCIIGLISALEELIIHLTSDQLDLNRKAFVCRP